MRLQVLLTTAALLGAVTTIPATAAPVTPPPAEKPKTVTLITGDKVTVAKRGDGWDVRVQPASRMGTPGGYLEQTSPDGVTVIPESVAHLVRTGRLDRALFDVTGLIEQGYDDARTPDVPLLVENGPAPQSLGRVTRTMPKISAVATPKNRAAELFDASGTTKIWLNAKAFPTLDQSVPQVKAPAAWQAGHTGAGASIAVLDTGYDPAHPDLAGIVTAERDFVGTGIRDTQGHGTHVASTAAGRGVASGGKYTGVAKGANLLVGKVCDADGCPFDAVIAGMQWAAESGARVVNMSLGGYESDGTDPLSAELNRLSAEHGTLFVVASGNDGPGVRVTSPAAADSALAVGSVSKQDVFTRSSAPGPRVGDYAIKPDIVAPGEAIVAARAAGTLEQVAVDEHHARLYGTSMAAPHVAGAAAILAALHPDWTGQQLKAALMSTADPISATVYQQGAGRLDVARAVTQRITATGSVSLGYIKYPHGIPPATQRIAYRNSSTAPVSLALTAEVKDHGGQTAPDGMFRTDVDEVTVPAGGEATVTVTFDHARGPVGTYGGHVVARSGDTVVRTAIGGYKEPPHHDLTLKVTDRNGTELPPTQSVVALLQHLDDPTVRVGPLTSNQPIRVPAGRYAILATVRTFAPGHAIPSLTQMAEPEFVVDKDTVVGMDAREGNKVGFRLDERDARPVGGRTGMSIRTGAAGTGLVNVMPDDHYAVPTQQRPHFMYFNRAQLDRPEVRLTVASPSFEVPVDWTPTSPKITDSRSLTAVDVGHARPEEIAAHDLRGKLAVFTLGAAEGEEYDARVRALVNAGAVAGMFYFSEAMSVQTTEQSAIPIAYSDRPEGPRLAKLGTAAVTLAGLGFSPYRYELLIPEYGGIPANVGYRRRNQDLAEVKARYHGSANETAAIDHDITDGRYNFSGGIWSEPIPLPLERTEYYSADPIHWQTEVRLAEQGYLGPQRGYPAGSRMTVDWNRAVVGPGITVSRKLFSEVDHLVFRDKDTITADLPLFSDSSRHSGHASSTSGTALYADGKLIGRSGVPGEGTFTVPTGPAGYRLVSDASRDHLLSTKVSAEWTFRSSHTETPTPLPLLAVGFDPKVDLTNQAAGGWTSFPIRVDRQPGAIGGAITLRQVEVSFDDGATWRAVPLVKIHDCWWTVFQQPRSGFVSLRASASDAGGNAVVQAVHRAYQLR